MSPMRVEDSEITRIVLASNNAKKLAELRRILTNEELPITVESLANYPAYPEPAETEHTFEGNALLKARAARQATSQVAVADDSGLEVDELNGMPGVRSARWSGPDADDQKNLELLLSQLSDVPDERRSARFVCALALVSPDGSEYVWRATMPGRLIQRPRGEHGFGYDPIFVPEGYDLTSAELTAEQKDEISHRGKAIRMLACHLRQLKERT